MKHRFLTILGRLDPARASTPQGLCELPARLRELRASEAGQCTELLAAGGVHFMSFFAIPCLDADAPACVVLEINCDRSPREMRRLLVEHARPLLDGLFRDCTDYGENDRARRAFLARNDIGADASYVAARGARVEQIRDEHALRQRVRTRYLGRIAQWAGRPSALWRELQQSAREEPLVRAPARRPFLVRWSPRNGGLRRLGQRALKLASAVVAVFAGGLGLFLVAGIWGSSRLLWLAALIAAVALLLVAIAYTREAPRGLAWRGKALVLRSALGDWLRLGVVLALGAGLMALLPGVVHRAPAALAALGPLLPSAVLALALAAAAVLVAVLGYVVAGAGGAIAVGLGAAGGGAWLVARFAHTPLQLALWTGLVLSLLGCLAAVAVARWLLRLRALETADPPGTLSWDLEHLDEVQQHEDRRGVTHQNHLATVSELKPGRLRLFTLRAVLRAVSLLSRFLFTSGDLGGIRTIHYARFVILPDKRRLLFCANYDLAFGSYLQEFNDVPGVTAVWSNTEGFPRAFLLAGAGARDEQRFKAFARRSQVPTLGWYSAYPRLGIADIQAAAATRDDLGRAVDDRSTFAGRLRARFGRPLSEADCDAALRRL